MKLSAPILSSLNRCERRYRLEREYRVLKRRPREVFNELLPQALLRISAGLRAKAAAEEMSASLMECAAHPGFDTPHDPYTLTQDLCAAAHTSLEFISRTFKLTLGRPRPADDWEFSCLAQRDGTLERWIAVESWDEAERFRQLHSWYVYGDCCAAGQAMNLVAIEIGPLRGGHYHSDWTRCYAHPALRNVYRFRKQDGSKLESSWKPAWLQNFSNKDGKDWVDGMQRDGVDPIASLHVKAPTEIDRGRFALELEYWGALMETPAAWRDIPMRRTSCDLPPCPWQPVCYAQGQDVEVEEMGSFVPLGVLQRFQAPAAELDSSHAAGSVGARLH